MVTAVISESKGHISQPEPCSFLVLIYCGTGTGIPSVILLL